MENLNQPNGNQEALNELNALRQEVYMMGANDYEIPAIDELIQKLEKGECTPEEALSQAESIKSKKADYH